MSGLGGIYDVTLTALRNHSRTLARLQEQAASGARVVRASDSPGEAYEILSFLEQERSLASLGKNAGRVTMDLEQASTALQGVSDNLISVKQLLTQAASGTYGLRDRATIAAQIDIMIEDMVSLANTQSMGRSVFGGAATATVPYSIQRADGKITSVTYQGSYTAPSTPVAPQVEHTGLLVGVDVFGGSASHKTPVFLGNTGAAAGTGTSSIRGDAYLTLTHEATAYGNFSGIVPGASSSDGDTILGLGHKLVLDADGRTVRLDDGPAVAFTDASVDLKLTNGAGDVAFVDMSGLDVGLTGTVDVTVASVGYMSLDDGLTTTAMTFTANQAVTDSRTGQTLYFNGSGVTRTGVEPIRVEGGYDLFGMLINIRDLLSNTRSLSAGEQGRLLGEAIASLDEVATGVTHQMTSVGGRLSALDGLSTDLKDMSDNARQQADSIKDADILEVAAGLARTQTFYEMTLAASAKAMSVSLLDYM